SEHDQSLPVDLDNALSVESFVHIVKNREEATLLEFFPGPGELCAMGPDGSYVHELLVPFTATLEIKRQAPQADATPIPSASLRSRNTPRTFAPGASWVFAKFYSSVSAADRVLIEVIAPQSRMFLKRRAIERWFFIRYADPDEHLRWRLRVPDGVR